MSPNKIEKIGIVAPAQYRHVLGLANIKRSFERSFPDATIFFLEDFDLRSLPRLQVCDLVILPPSFYGEDTPYKHYLTGKAAHMLDLYASTGRLATFCSGTYAILKRFSYVFNNGKTENYEGYVPLVDLDAYGPLGHHPHNPSALRIMPVFSKAVSGGASINLCYDGGPGIKWDPNKQYPDMRPLAFFDNQTVSILAQRQSSGGIVMAFSSLAEIHAVDVPCDEKFGDVHNSLLKTQHSHTALWDQSMAILESRDLNI